MDIRNVRRVNAAFTDELGAVGRGAEEMDLPMHHSKQSDSRGPLRVESASRLPGAGQRILADVQRTLNSA
jgi:hypothetical protein